MNNPDQQQQQQQRQESAVLYAGSPRFLEEEELVHLRIFHINDVYELENLPRLHTAVQTLRLDEASLPGRRNLLVLGGDFLAPSALSAVDSGRAMVDMLNRLGCDFVTIGNHETDVSLQEFVLRVQESNFPWLNSNMENLPVCVPSMAKKFPITLQNGRHSRQVVFLGLLTNDPGLYKPSGNFWDARIAPVFDSAFALFDEVVGPEVASPTLPPRRRKSRPPEEISLDEISEISVSATVPVSHFAQPVVIPVTHQGWKADRVLAGLCGGKFPVILGAHDHTPGIETIGNDAATIIANSGSDAANFVCLDLTWKTRNSPQQPEVFVQLVSTRNFREDETLKRVVSEHQDKAFRELARTAVTDFPKDLHSPENPISSHNVRIEQKTIGKFIASKLRRALLCDFFPLVSGAVRRNYVYPADHETFTYLDFAKELPFGPVDELVVLDMPFAVLKDVVDFSWSVQKKGTGGYLQLCDRLDKALAGNTEISGNFRVGLTVAALQGVDGNVPLLEWKRNAQVAVPTQRIDASSAFLLAIAREDLINKQFPITLFPLDLPTYRARLYPHNPAWYAEKLFALLDADKDGLIGENDAAIAAVACWLNAQEEIQEEEINVRLKKLFATDKLRVKGLEPDARKIITRKTFSKIFPTGFY